MRSSWSRSFSAQGSGQRVILANTGQKLFDSLRRALERSNNPTDLFSKTRK